ncbi:hypothetical protein SESBI_29261 [Sesbania bispinosa]|nr:hypothetical protein SESBI_29261 [Sesbania bispinosa]
MAGVYDEVQNIIPGRQNWKLKVRVVRVWAMYPVDEPSRTFSVEMVLVDQAVGLWFRVLGFKHQSVHHVGSFAAGFIPIWWSSAVEGLVVLMDYMGNCFTVRVCVRYGRMNFCAVVEQLVMFYGIDTPMQVSFTMINGGLFRMRLPGAGHLEVQYSAVVAVEHVP